jgi:hypothetical protein
MQRVPWCYSCVRYCVYLPLDGVLTLTSASGIGVNRTLSVHIVEPVGPGSTILRWINGTSAMTFAFEAPSLLYVTPSTLGTARTDVDFSTLGHARAEPVQSCHHILHVMH